MKAWLIGTLMLATGAAAAQSNRGVHLRFESSRVVLASGDTLAGPVEVQFSTDLLHLKQPDGSVRTFAPASVAAFAVQGQAPLRVQGTKNGVVTFDPTVVRLFRTVPCPSERPDHRPEPLFFEQLSQGPVLLLRRQSVVPHQIALPVSGEAVRAYGGMTALPGRPVPASTPVQYRTVNGLEDVFYLAWASGEVRPLRHPQKDLLAAFPAQAQQLQAYARARKLGYTHAEELHQLVTYANSLSPSAAP